MASNFWPRSVSERSPRTPAAKAALLAKPRHHLIVQRFGSHRFALTGDAAEEGATRDTGQLQLGLQGDGQVASDEPSPISTSASRSCPAT